MQLKIEPDTQEAREEILMAVATKLEGPPPKDYSLPPNGKIELTFHPYPDRPVVTILFDGEMLYAPYFDVFQEVVANTRSSIEVTLLDDSAKPVTGVTEE